MVLLGATFSIERSARKSKVGLAAQFSDEAA
jgi:hypothetical protein